MTYQVDLNEVRRVTTQNQEQGARTPLEPAKAIVVSKQGQLAFGSDADKVSQPISNTPQDSFHSSARQLNEARDVEKYLPDNTTPLTTDEGITGWTYSFSCEFGIRYTMFLFFNGGGYEVMLMSPQLENKYRDAHTGHLYRDGRLCLSAHQMRDLRETFAKSVLWANGLSAAMKSGAEFPFSINNRNGAHL